MVRDILLNYIFNCILFSCYSEAKFAYNLKKPIIPIGLDSHYRPDDWVLFILDDEIWPDFSKGNKFEKTCWKLYETIRLNCAECSITIDNCE